MFKRLKPVVFNVLLFEDEEMLSAQCIEFDIAAQGIDIESACASFLKTFLGQCVLGVDNPELWVVPMVYKQIFKEKKRKRRLVRKLSVGNFRFRFHLEGATK